MRVAFFGATEGAIVVSTQQRVQDVPRCTLCPAGCTLSLAAVGPDKWRVEYPLTESPGLCPRGSTLGELLSHHRRIVAPSVCADGGRREVTLEAALGAILDAAGDAGVTILLDGNVPCEQLVQAAAWCSAWESAKLCFVVEPAEEQLILGVEASGAEHLPAAGLSDCDGFLVIGDAFASNPICSRAIFDRRAEHRRTPLVTLDPACGAVTKFASHGVAVEAGMELAALAAVAKGAGIDADVPCRRAAEIPSAEAGGKALARCKRLGVLLTAEYARNSTWRQIGYLAGQLAKAMGGGVAVQTAGANALAAVRLAYRLKTAALSEALSAEDDVCVVVGCDLIGMLGWSDTRVAAAAAALPNQTTERADVVLPVALSAECGGTYLLGGAEATKVSPLLAPPAGVPTPGDLVAALAAQAGVAKPEIPTDLPSLDRPAAQAPQPVELAAGASAPALLLGRQALQAGCCELTGYASWQQGDLAEAPLRISPQYAAQLGLKDLTKVRVRVGERSVQAQVRFSPELSGGKLVLPEWLPGARALAPARIEDETILSGPVCAEVSN